VANGIRPVLCSRPVVNAAYLSESHLNVSNRVSDIEGVKAVCRRSIMVQAKVCLLQMVANHPPGERQAESAIGDGQQNSRMNLGLTTARFSILPFRSL
jgi:hypothetical protein